MDHVLLLDENNIFIGDVTKDLATKNGLNYTEVALPIPCPLLNPRFNGAAWEEGPVRVLVTPE